MKKRKNLSLWLLFVLLGLSACTTDPVEVDVEKYQNDLVVFTVTNNTDQDIYSVEFEFSYYAEDGTLIKSDTIGSPKVTDMSGGTAKPNSPFVKTGDYTFMTQKMPEGATKASGKAIDYSFEKE